MKRAIRAAAQLLLQGRLQGRLHGRQRTGSCKIRLNAPRLFGTVPIIRFVRARGGLKGQAGQDGVRLCGLLRLRASDQRTGSPLR
jgi:hypothetical protein